MHPHVQTSKQDFHMFVLCGEVKNVLLKGKGKNGVPKTTKSKDYRSSILLPYAGANWAHGWTTTDIYSTIYSFQLYISRWLTPLLANSSPRGYDLAQSASPISLSHPLISRHLSPVVVLLSSNRLGFQRNPQSFLSRKSLPQKKITQRPAKN
jgi:hypothetical protein